MSYLPISINKLSSATFLRLECGCVGDLSFFFLLSPRFPTPTLQLMLRQEGLVIFPSLMNQHSPFNWRTVPSDTRVPVLIPLIPATGAIKGRHHLQEDQKQYLDLRTFQGVIQLYCIFQRAPFFLRPHTCLSPFVVPFTCSRMSIQPDTQAKNQLGGKTPLKKPRRQAAQQQVIVSSGPALKSIWQSRNLLR